MAKFSQMTWVSALLLWDLPLRFFTIKTAIHKVYVIFMQKGADAMKRKKKQPVIRCPYCGRTAVLQKASYVYREKALDEYLYVCSGYPACDAYVGVHAGTLRPKGSLANGDLRHKRIEAHRLFDAIWKNGIMSRKDAYRWIQDTFSLSDSQAHIGQYWKTIM